MNTLYKIVILISVACIMIQAVKIYALEKEIDYQNMILSEPSELTQQ